MVISMVYISGKTYDDINQMALRYSKNFLTKINNFIINNNNNQKVI